MPGQQDLVVGRVGRAHGVRGDVAVEVRTDVPELRFAVGVRLRTDPESAGPLIVTQRKEHSGRLLLHFTGIDDRAAAEALAGTWLVIGESEAGQAGDGAWWDHELLGLAVHDGAGALLGQVSEVVHLPGQELLAVVTLDGREVLVPFVQALVPEVDVASGRVVVTPPEGLFEL
ncbi:MAG TPA: ribosome maturation factor RimM [Mycobacteriales bacterium]|nr:ribosome maturation factor RimM [Mycobacteriales bacterium]